MVTAIQTEYAGCLFRSRLEARWAVVFDVLGLKWRYEPEGFELSNGKRYLPDFFIESIGWIEIKPTAELDDDKWTTFCEDNGKQDGFKAYRITGDIPDPRFDDMPDDLTIEAAFGGLRGGSGDTGYGICVCLRCGKVGIEWDGRGGRICSHDQDKGHSADSARIKTAYIAARSWRF